MVSKRFALIASSVLAVLALSGCDNRKCIESHTNWMMLPKTQCYPNGKTTTCTTTLVYTPVWVCDRYEEPSKEPM